MTKIEPFYSSRRDWHDGKLGFFALIPKTGSQEVPVNALVGYGKASYGLLNSGFDSLIDYGHPHDEENHHMRPGNNHHGPPLRVRVGKGNGNGSRT